jgi:uncharacterized HhH-GPD family protein
MPKAAYPFTPDLAANAELAASGTALLIGLCLEQQVRSEKAMSGPHVLRTRIGHLDAARIAAMPEAELESVFRAKPAIHRFPAMMSKRVRQLCAAIAEKYDDDGERLWARVKDAAEIFRRLRELPGFGEGKAACGVRILAKFGKRPLSGWEKFGSDDDLPWVFRGGKRVEAE